MRKKAQIKINIPPIKLQTQASAVLIGYLQSDIFAYFAQSVIFLTQSIQTKIFLPPHIYLEI